VPAATHTGRKPQVYRKGDHVTKKKKPVRRVAPKRKRMQKTSVALVRRKPASLPKPATTGERQLAVQLARTVTDGFALDTLGLVSLRTTPEQEKILSREPSPDDISVLPDGAPYCPHPVYTRWLNEAFRRGGWQLAPVSKPALIESTVTVKYILYVDGKAVALADGQQEYHANNRNQSYGDVLEATRSNALRRCCKHLAIGLQLWDKRFSAKWRREYCVQVTVRGRKKDGDQWIDADVTQWRRKDDDPLPKEVRAGRAARTEPAHEEHSKMDEAISDEKRVRFWRIAKRVGRKEDDIKRWLKKHYSLTDTKQIKNRDYDKIVRILESPGALPNGQDHVHEGIVT
jgi:hypothetical protein